MSAKVHVDQIIYDQIWGLLINEWHDSRPSFHSSFSKKLGSEKLNLPKGLSYPEPDNTARRLLV